MFYAFFFKKLWWAEAKSSLCLGEAQYRVKNKNALLAFTHSKAFWFCTLKVSLAYASEQSNTHTPSRWRKLAGSIG